MIRYFLMLAAFLAAMSASANEHSYFRVMVSGVGEMYEYRFYPHTFALSLASSCREVHSSTCKAFAEPFYRASTESRLQRTVIFSSYPDTSPHKFEVHNLETGAIEMSATTKRRISKAEMLGTHGCVLMLTYNYRIGWMPWDLLFTLSGHPPQYDTEVYCQ